VIDVAGYLGRIGARRPTEPSLAGLRVLQERHLATVPFENLSIHLGEWIRLDEDALVDKVVRRGRGGFCYELNGAFAALLTALGYRVSLVSAQVYSPDGELSAPFDHMALLVDLAEPWLVDVGFGRFSRWPLRLLGLIGTLALLGSGVAIAYIIGAIILAFAAARLWRGPARSAGPAA